MEEYRKEAAIRYRKALGASAARASDDGKEEERRLELYASPQTLASIVRCAHGPQGRCSLCAGLELVERPGARAACGAFERVYRAVPCARAHELAEADRSARVRAGGEAHRALVYGEVLFWPFAHLLCEGLRVGDGDVFTDLGSGSGRAVLAAALLFPRLAEARGVELLPALHRAAEGRAAELRALGVEAAPVRLELGDVFERPWWRDTTAAFAACTGFSEAMMERLARLAERMPEGARVATFTRALPSSPARFRVTLERKYRASWGNVSVFVQERV